tara:strand:- start:1969 stop:2208 length:240 start_codon:yes stop_codon:yes gene_type:complete
MTKSNTEKPKANLATLPLSANYTVDQALAAAKNKKLTDVLMVGYNADGELICIGSRMTRRDALWMIEHAKDNALYGPNA